MLGQSSQLHWIHSNWSPESERKDQLRGTVSLVLGGKQAVFPISCLYLCIFLKQDPICQEKSACPASGKRHTGWLVGLGDVCCSVGHINACSVHSGSPLWLGFLPAVVFMCVKLCQWCLSSLSASISTVSRLCSVRVAQGSFSVTSLVEQSQFFLGH